uniref:Retrotransposon gag domain-containing protein n=1 Tax=Nyssomyia neivai TaxID=330878 RepID=A0A1L8DIK3_9DIPT
MPGSGGGQVGGQVGEGTQAGVSGSVNVRSAIIGSMSEFVPGEDFIVYREMMDEFLYANRVTNDREKCSWFLTRIGAQCYAILRSAVQPRALNTLTYKALVDAMSEKFAPKTNVIQERCKFFQRNQEMGESIAEYVVELQKLAQTCNFDQYTLDDALRDRMTLGVRARGIQEKLMNSRRPFEESYQEAISMELTQAHSRKVAEINAVKAKWRNGKSVKDTKKHDKKKILCYKCHKWGTHVASECDGKAAHKDKRGGAGKRTKKGRVNHADEDEDSDSDSSDIEVPGRLSALGLSIHALRRAPEPEEEELFEDAELQELDSTI